jgi:hypothetical protein
MPNPRALGIIFLSISCNAPGYSRIENNLPASAVITGLAETIDMIWI